MKNETSVDRRAALGAMGVMGVMATGVLGAQAGAPAKGLLTPTQLGYDAVKGEFTLPPLPYKPEALEPHIDAQTMTIHHDKHHAGYVAGLNKALAELAKIRAGQGDAGLIKHWSREASFHGAGHLNHSLFWVSLAPAGQGGGGQPSGRLADSINAQFGSFEAFASQFKAASVQVEGGGWGYFAIEPVSTRLLVLQVEKQQDMMPPGVVPLLGIDVWEHAYYLKYQNKRADYVTAVMNVINWSAVQARFEAFAG